jgi:hypothetical protein
MNIKLVDGKYALVHNEFTGTLTALRNGQWWQDLTGNNLVYCLGSRIEELQEQLNVCENPTEISKSKERLNAGRVLGIRDADLKILQYEDRDREGLLTTILIKDASLEASIISDKKAKEFLLTRLKDAITAKKLANTRADAAEQKLREIQKTLGGIKDAIQ